MKVVALITSKFGADSYYGIQTPKVTNYAIDSAMDTDSDSWSIDVGDVNSELIAVFDRDSEVRVDLIGGSTRSGAIQLKRGFADVLGKSKEGLLSIQGRDFSATAVDSTIPPHSFPVARPSALIPTQARTLGFSRFKIVPVSPMNGMTVTDGSESYWQFWYRLVRNKQMWIWVSADGTLHVAPLNYAAVPKYFFGEPQPNYPGSYLRVEDCQLRKDTKARIYEIAVYYETGKKSTFISERDPAISDWVKKPTNLTLSAKAITTRAAAIKEAQEQLFEGKVGSLEYLVTITDPGIIIEQN